MSFDSIIVEPLFNNRVVIQAEIPEIVQVDPSGLGDDRVVHHTHLLQPTLPILLLVLNYKSQLCQLDGLSLLVIYEPIRHRKKPIF